MSRLTFVGRVGMMALGVAVGVMPAAAQQFTTSYWNSGWTQSGAMDISSTGEWTAMWNNYNGVNGLLQVQFAGPNIVLFATQGAPGGWGSGVPRAVSADGFTFAGFGSYWLPGFPPQLGERAFLWSYPSWPTTMLFPIGGFDSTRAWGMSGDAQVVVGDSTWNSFTTAVRWQGPGYAPQDLGTLPSQFGSSALAVSEDGTTIVGKSGVRAFRWTQQVGMVDLGSLPGQQWAEATGVNSTGSVIVGIWNNGTDRGFRWTPATGMVDIPALPGGALVRPRAVSAAGDVIVGQAGDPNVPGGLSGFVWTPLLGTQTCISHLVGRGLFAMLPVSYLTDVTSVAPDGRSMCGNTVQNGQNVGWAARNLLCASMTPAPTVMTVCPGGRANFIPWGGPGGTMGGALNFQWYRNGVPLVDGPQPGGSYVENATWSNMSISNVSSADLATYHCVAHSAGTCVQVGPNIPLVFTTPPTVTVEPVDTNGCAGGMLSLFAQAQSTTVGSVVYRWQKRVSPFPNVYADIFDGPSGTGSTYSGTGTQTLTIFNTQPGDTQRYRCVVSDTLCGTGYFNSTYRAQVTVNAETAITQNPSNVVMCPSDTTAVLTVAATPAGQVTYQWHRLQAPFPNVYAPIYDGPTGNGGTYSGTQTPTLTLTNIGPADRTRYRCVVSGPCGFEQTSTNALISTGSALTVTAQPVDQIVCLGGTGTLSVTASAGAQTYQWRRAFMGTPVFDGATGFGSTVSGANTPTLTISGFAVSDMNQYYCEVNGTCGPVNSNSAVLLACIGDADCDGDADSDDIIAFFGYWNLGANQADTDGDGDVDSDDVVIYFEYWNQGC